MLAAEANDGGLAAEGVPLAAAQVRRIIVATCGLMFYQGYAMSINGIASPYVARSFGLDESGIARLFAWISLSSIGALVLSRMADKVGRRRVLVWCMTATPIAALAAAAAQDLFLFTICEIFLYAFSTATVSSSVVMLAEGLPIEQRARGQSFGGMALGLGGGLCVILIPMLADTPYSWRWLLLIAGGGLLVVPLVRRGLPESERWQRAASSGSTERTRFYDVFKLRYRRRAVPVLVCYLLSMMASTAITSWGYFHAVSVVRLSATMASVMMIAGGGMSMIGLTLGAWSAERFGRVPTVAIASLMVAAGSIVFYWGPPVAFVYPAVWLAGGFCWFMSAANAWMVGGNSAATELFPTALRGTMVGWFAIAQAIAAVSTQGVIALLAQPLGGLSVVVGYLSLLAIPSAIIFFLCVEETRGLSLEAAAREAI